MIFLMGHYEGHWEENKRNGIGIQIYKNGDKYSSAGFKELDQVKVHIIFEWR